MIKKNRFYTGSPRFRITKIQKKIYIYKKKHVVVLAEIYGRPKRAFIYVPIMYTYIYIYYITYIIYYTTIRDDYPQVYI